MAAAAVANYTHPRTKYIIHILHSPLSATILTNSFQPHTLYPKRVIAWVIIWLPLHGNTNYCFTHAVDDPSLLRGGGPNSYGTSLPSADAVLRPNELTLARIALSTYIVGERSQLPGGVGNGRWRKTSTFINSPPSLFKSSCSGQSHTMCHQSFTSPFEHRSASCRPNRSTREFMD